jgi:hypothetical protein
MNENKDDVVQNFEVVKKLKEIKDLLIEIKDNM